MSARDFQVDNLSAVGLVSDLKSHQLPPEAWTSALNMRFKEKAAVRLLGRTSILSAGVAPYFIMPVKSSAEALFLLFASLTKVHCYNSATDTDITRAAGGDYNATGARDWNGTIHGGIPIVNSGNDALQQWATVSAGTKLTLLTNWNAAWRARVVRSLWPHMVALNVNIAGTAFPHGVLWSHPSDPGAVPTSWDYTSEVVDAGLWELPDSNAGVILDGKTLRGQLLIYKEKSVWSMRFIGGRPVFAFNNVLENVGLFATRCVAPTGDGKGHFFVSQDDVLFYNGSDDPISLVEAKVRRALFNNIDTTNYKTSFVFANPAFKEMWFCYPEPGQTMPSRALIWNYGVKSEIGAITEAEVDFQCAAIGDVEAASSPAWSAASYTWDAATDPWSISNRNVPLVGKTSNTKILQLDSGTTYDGTAFTATLAREGLPFAGRKWDGTPIVDFSLVKFVPRIWLEATGGPFNVRLGYAQVVGGTVTWTAVQSFDPATQLYLDFENVVGAAIALEITSTAAFDLVSHKMEIVNAGRVLVGQS